MKYLVALLILPLALVLAYELASDSDSTSSPSTNQCCFRRRPDSNVCIVCPTGTKCAIDSYRRLPYCEDAKAPPHRCWAPKDFCFGRSVLCPHETRCSLDSQACPICVQ